MFKRTIVLTGLFILIVQTLLNAQYISPALEGGSGLIYTQTARTYGRGYMGIGFNGIYNISKMPISKDNEHLFAGVSSLTYILTDDIGLSAALYAIGRGKTSGNSDVLDGGFGKARLACKLHMPLDIPSFDLAGRVAIDIPMGANFMIHPSYPYDTDVYSLSVLALQSYQISPSLDIHMNEGYCWQGLREKYVDRSDLLLLDVGLGYMLKHNWHGHSELSSAIELDDKVQPIRDRLVFVQGIEYVTPLGFNLNLAASFRLNKKRLDGTTTRAENFRILCGVSFGLYTVQPDTDKDGIPDEKDLEPNTPMGWPTDSRGRSLDSDGDGVSDGMDIEPNTRSGSRVDIQGKAIPSMEIELLNSGLLRVHRIYFDVNRSDIKAESFAVLDEIGRILVKHPELIIQISGHTDATGTDEFNNRLSLDRANSVRSYLVDRFPEINEGNLTIIGYGRSRPLSDDETEQGRTQNRRVEFRVLNLDDINR